jgi:putative redox protein
VKRAIDLSAEKYCSASIMLGATAEITHDFTVIEVGAAQ